MKNKYCEICTTQEAKYKCSNCRIHYCTVTCYKVHKNSECKSVKDTQEVEALNPRKYRFPTEDTVPQEKLGLLGESKALINILKDRHLRDILKSVDTSSDASWTIQSAMQEPPFVQFVDECLRIVEPDM